MRNEDLLVATVVDLERIWDACRLIDLSTLEIPSREMGFVALAVNRMARFVNQIGHDGSTLHESITDYLIRLTEHADVRLAMTGTYALADHGLEPNRVLDRLKCLVNSERRPDDHPDVTLRAVALRMLRRLDEGIAAQIADSDAMDDYSHAIDHWRATDGARNPETIRELEFELAWLKSIKRRRTMG